jgi:two-component system, OmpR family, response regulator TctD
MRQLAFKLLSPTGLFSSLGSAMGRRVERMRVLLAEDNPQLATWLAKALRQSRFAIDCLRDGVAADHSLSTEDYDAVILDLNLPKMDGLEVLRRLRQRGSRTPVLVLSARGALDDRVAGLNLGADDYLGKPFELSELEARLNALIRRSQGGGSAAITVGALEYECTGRMFRLGDNALVLRPREHAVLEVLVLHAGKVVSKDSLYEKVFDLDATASADCVEIYVHRLRKRLDGSDVAIVTVRGLGYTLETLR